MRHLLRIYLDFFAHLGQGVLGWRYLCSQRYREQVKHRWLASSPTGAHVEMLGLTLSFVLVTASVAIMGILVFLVAAALRTID